MKKLIALLLALVMVLALAACAAKMEPAKTETTDTKTEQTTTEETKTEDPAPAEETTGEKMYIPVMAKGFQHQFWQAVAKGSEDAAKDLGVEIYFDGPASETEIDAQVNMVKNELAKNPKAMALAALSTEAVTEILEECAEKNIPVIIGCLSQDAVSASVSGRTTGFVNEMAKIAETYQPGKVSIEGHAKWEKKVDAPAIIIEVAISATTEATAVQTAANSLLGMNPVAIFCSNEGAVTGFLAAVSDGEDLAEGGKYAGLVVAGFDAGAAQKNAVRQGWFYGSVTQDPYQIGYQAVALAVAAANGEPVADVDTGAQWYDASNIDDEMIALLVYD